MLEYSLKKVEFGAGREVDVLPTNDQKLQPITKSPLVSLKFPFPSIIRHNFYVSLPLLKAIIYVDKFYLNTTRIMQPCFQPNIGANQMASAKV